MPRTASFNMCGNVRATASCAKRLLSTPSLHKPVAMAHTSYGRSLHSAGQRVRALQTLWRPAALCETTTTTMMMMMMMRRAAQPQHVHASCTVRGGRHSFRHQTQPQQRPNTTLHRASLSTQCQTYAYTCASTHTKSHLPKRLLLQHRLLPRDLCLSKVVYLCQRLAQFLTLPFRHHQPPTVC